MTWNRIILWILICAISQNTNAQAINNTALARSMGNRQSFRVNWENDFFTATDYYYTQGTQFESIQPFFRKNPINFILIRPVNARKQYGLALEQDLYTPIDYPNPQIQFGDRPFAGALYLQSFVIATRKKDRIVTTLSTGVIGPAAGGKQFMTTIHKWTNNADPRGWDNQIANAVVLNYEIQYERLLFKPCPYFLLSADGLARAGTLSIKANVGVTGMVGLFQFPFGTEVVNRNFQLYFYDHPDFGVVGYDATMQGGAFNPSSPYTITSSNITRTVFSNIFGFVFRYKALYLEYYQTYITEEFDKGLDHHTGGIQIGIGIR